MDKGHLDQNDAPLANRPEHQMLSIESLSTWKARVEARELLPEFAVTIGRVLGAGHYRASQLSALRRNSWDVPELLNLG